jgi:hypothetical protein
MLGRMVTSLGIPCQNKGEGFFSVMPDEIFNSQRIRRFPLKMHTGGIDFISACTYHDVLR